MATFLKIPISMLLADLLVYLSSERNLNKSQHPALSVLTSSHLATAPADPCIVTVRNLEYVAPPDTLSLKSGSSYMKQTQYTSTESLEACARNTPLQCVEV
jgi:hypothetical protein